MVGPGVLRAVISSLLFIFAMKQMQSIFRDRFDFVMSNVMLAWLCFVAIAIAVVDGKVFLSTTKTAVYFTMMLVGFSGGTFVERARRSRKGSLEDKS